MTIYQVVISGYGLVFEVRKDLKSAHVFTKREDAEAHIPECLKMATDGSLFSIDHKSAKAYIAELYLDEPLTEEKPNGS